MKYLKISNQTEIDENAFTLLGACTKRDDSNKIGYFGSGLKYAIAVLLRENIEFKVFSGEKEIVIGLESQLFREQAFNVITVNGKKTSLTTSMGVDWKIWQAIREIFCNALDETDSTHGIVEEIIPKDGVTSFYLPVGNEEIQQILNSWDNYFSFNRTQIAGDCCKIFHSLNDTTNIYRKGIRCHDSSFHSLYDYDFSKIRINESRTIKYTWEINEGIAQLWGVYATPQMITNLISMYKEHNSHDCQENYADWNYANFSDVWKTYFQDKILIPQDFAGHFPGILRKSNSVILPNKLIRRLKKQFGDAIQTASQEIDDSGSFCITKPNEKQTFLLKECMDFFEEVKLTIPYDIKIGVFNKKAIYGIAKNGNIILSTTVFEQGKKMIATAILHEWAHLESEENDETRGFEMYLTNQILTLLENQNGIFL